MSDLADLDVFGSVCGGNVERLAVRSLSPRHPPADLPAPAPVIDAAPIIAAIEKSIAEAHQAALRAIPEVAQRAVQAALHSVHGSFIGTLQAIASILAVRFILLLAVIGGFLLAWMVLRDPTVIGAAILGGYVVSSIWPLVWLFSRAPGSSGTSRGNSESV